MARSLRVTEVVVIAFLVSISQSFVLAQAINDPSAQADIHATHIASNFVSGINSFGYYTNPDTNRGYYLIGSTDQRHEQTASNVTTPIVADRTGIIQPLPNETTFATVSKNETISPAANKNISIITNADNILIMISQNKTETIPPVTNKTTSQVTTTRSQSISGDDDGDGIGHENLIKNNPIKSLNSGKTDKPGVHKNSNPVDTHKNVVNGFGQYDN